MIKLEIKNNLYATNEKEQVSARYSERIPPYLNPVTRDVLQQLQSQKRRLGVICNTGRTPRFALQHFLDDEGVTPYFDVLLFSDEVGIRKPDPRIFHRAVTMLDVPPSAIVHVGDNPRTDVWGAQQAGFKAIYLTSDEGHDLIAESDPTSLAAISRQPLGLSAEEIIPDQTITSLNQVIETIAQLSC